MDEDAKRSLVPLAGGVGAGIGSTVPIVLQAEGLVALAAAAAAGALVAGTLSFALSALRG